MFNVALVSRWHVHSHKPDERYVKEFLRQPGCKVTCVWDENVEIAKEWAQEYGVEYETDLEVLLSRDDVDGVIVTSKASDHRRIFIAAAEHKKHIFTEKVLSLTLEDALAIREAVVRNGVKFCISFNRLAIKQLAYAKKLVEEGTLGQPVMFRCLCCHAEGVKDSLPQYWYDPAITGGGALIDMGFNSAYLARYIMGEMESVSASTDDSILQKLSEDTASCNVRFKSGAMGLLDASFCSPAMSVFELAVYGTAGAYYARFGGNDIAELRLMGKDKEEIPLDKIPHMEMSPMECWVSACTKDTSDALYGVDAACDMVKYMVAAYESKKNNGVRTQI